MISDELLEEMIRISDQQAEVLKKEANLAPELRIDESQFSMLDPESKEELNLMNLAFVENAVVKEAVDYDGQDKELLKEKKKATDHPDIVEQAHPETAYMAEGPMGTGVVENQNEQHQKILNVVQRMPSGFHYNKFADLVDGLTKMAAGLEEKGDSEAAKKVDSLAFELVSNLNDFLAPTPGAIKKADSKDIPAAVPGVKPYKAPAIPADKALVRKKPSNLVKVKTPEVLPSSLPPGPNQKLLNPPKSKVPHNMGPPKSGPLTIRPNTLPGHGRPSFSPPKGGPLMKRPNMSMVGPKAPGLWKRLSKVLKGKGGKATLLLAGIGAAAFLYNELNSAEPTIQGNIQTIASKSKNPNSSNVAKQLSDQLNSVKSALERGQSEQAIEGLALGDEHVTELLLSVADDAPEVRQAANELVDSWQGVASKANAFINRGLKEQGESAKDDRDRIIGVQKFLQEHFDPSHPTTGFMDERTKKSLHDFVEEMKNDLGIAPKLLTVKNLIEQGNNDKLERLLDIWKRPHLYAKEAG